MNNLSDRFRHWYDHERDCNAKTLKMLESVPEGRRSGPEFQQGVDLMAHMIAARRMWLHRIGHWPVAPASWSLEGAKLENLRDLLAPTQTAWVEYLGGLDDEQLAREVTWKGFDGKRRRWPLEAILTQVSGHAWYHRGQIVVLVKQLGGETASTDYYFWNLPVELDAASAPA